MRQRERRLSKWGRRGVDELPATERRRPRIVVALDQKLPDAMIMPVLSVAPTALRRNLQITATA